jgi:hypothetical protein
MQDPKDKEFRWLGAGITPEMQTLADDINAILKEMPEERLAAIREGQRKMEALQEQPYPDREAIEALRVMIDIRCQLNTPLPDET